MKSIPKSNHYYANSIIRLYLLSVEDVIGKNGLNAILNLGQLSHLVDNYPPENLDREIDFADFSTLNQALEEVYGVRGGRLLGMRAGKVYFQRALEEYGEPNGFFSPEFKAQSPLEKLRIGLNAAGSISNQVSDQNVTVEEHEDKFVYSIGTCPACWGISGEESSVCSMPLGFIQGCVSWLLDGKECSVVEEKCIAMGDAACEFVIQKPAES